jgi:hypothetical protein
MTTRGKFLWQRTKTAIGHLKLWWRASAAYEKPVSPTSPLAKFEEGEQIPLKGLVFVVGKIVDGPLPVLLLSPVERTARAEKSAGARLKRTLRLARNANRQEALRDIRRARRGGF